MACVLRENSLPLYLRHRNRERRAAHDSLKKEQGNETERWKTKAAHLTSSAAQVTMESSASGIAALDLVGADDILGADSDLQRAFALDCYGAIASAFGHYPFAANRPDVHTISGSLLLPGGVSQTRV